MEQKFDEHAALEADMRRLAGEVERQKEIESREVIKAALGAKIQEREPVGAAPEARTDGFRRAEAIRESPLPSYAEEMTPELKLAVEGLIDVAWHKGIDAAVSDAKALAKQKGGPALLDIFHDALTGKLHEEMARRGLL